VAEACDRAVSAAGDLLALADSPAARLSPVLPAASAGPGDRIGVDPAELLADGRARLAELRHEAQWQAPYPLLDELVAWAVACGRGAQGLGGAGSGLGTQLWLLAARFAEFAGWMAQEAGQDATAVRWTQAAARWAAHGGELDMSGYRWERHALLALYAGDGAGTVELARRAAAGRTVSRRIQALAARREAQGHALSGDAGACRRALDRAEALLPGAPAPYPYGPSWGPNTIGDSGAVIEASCLIDLGDYRAAGALLGTAPGEDTPGGALRTRVRFAMRGALAHAGAGQVELSCALLHRHLLDLERLDSATIRTDLRRLAAMLIRRRSHPAVRAALPDLHHVIRPVRGEGLG